MATSKIDLWAKKSTPAPTDAPAPVAGAINPRLSPTVAPAAPAPATREEVAVTVVHNDTNSRVPAASRRRKAHNAVTVQAKRRDQHLSFTVSAEERELLLAYVDEHGMFLSAFVREACFKHMKKAIPPRR